MKEAEEATAPYQHAFGTKVGCECVAHFAVQYRRGRTRHGCVSGRNRCIRHHFQTGDVVRGDAGAQWRQGSVMADFGQTDFGQPSLASPFGRPILAKPSLPCGVVCLCVLCGVGVGFTVSWCGVSRVGVPPFPPGPPFPGPPKISLFFSFSRRKIRSFLPLWGSSRWILVVFLKAGALKCARLESAKFWAPHPSGPTLCGFEPPPFDLRTSTSWVYGAPFFSTHPRQLNTHKKTWTINF